MKHLRVLVVAPSPSLAFVLSRWLLPKYDVLTARNYHSAKTQLECHPDAVVTPVRLGDYNGLQLTLHAQAIQIPAIVIHVDDPVLQQDALRLGVTCFSSADLSRDRLLTALDLVMVHGPESEAAAGLGWATFSDLALSRLPHARRFVTH